MAKTQRKPIPEGFIRTHLREGFGVEDIGQKLRGIGVNVTNDNIRSVVNYWRDSGLIAAILRRA